MFDSTLALMTTGYAWLPDRRRRSGGKPVRTRLLGKRTVAIHGPEAVRFFYDESHVHRHGALPAPVLDTLFGRGAVHTLDGTDHRVRKALFIALLKDRGGLRSLTGHLNARWESACEQWVHRGQVVLFEESSLLLTRAACDWSGIPLADGVADETARDHIAMVDGFTSAGPRHMRARRARSRQEARIAELIEATRRGTHTAPDGSVLQTVAAHRDASGHPLDPHTAAVEVLNVIRPTVAVTWFPLPSPRTPSTGGPNTANSSPTVTPPTLAPSPTRSAGSTRSRRSSAASPQLICTGTVRTSPRAAWSCSTCTDKTTTRVYGPTRTPSTPPASWTASPTATPWCRKEGATPRPTTAAPARTSP